MTEPTPDPTPADSLKHALDELAASARTAFDMIVPLFTTIRDFVDRLDDDEEDKP
jgi:hypothetical protein